MTRDQLEHIIRAAAEITGEYEFVIVGSQSILGTYPNPPAAFTASMEADIYPLNAPGLAEKIEGTIGEFSDFHTLHGYYAEGIDPAQAKLPSDWMSRVCRVQNANTRDRVAYCLSVLDLFIAKAVAGREKDREFCIALLQFGYVEAAQALEKAELVPLNEHTVGLTELRKRIRRWERTALG